jgi:hypothetical protein
MGDEANELGRPPFNWERPLRWLFVVGLALWVVVGAIGTVLLLWFTDSFYSGLTEDVARPVERIYKAAITVEGIAFKLWIASAVLLLFLWLWARRPSGRSPSN